MIDDMNPGEEKEEEEMPVHDPNSSAAGNETAPRDTDFDEAEGR